MDIENSGSAKAPFKSTEWLQKKKQQKAFKNLKQNKTLKQICVNEMTNLQRINCIFHFIPHSYLTDLHLDAPASTKPAKKYCDVTGFEVR